MLLSIPGECAVRGADSRLAEEMLSSISGASDLLEEVQLRFAHSGDDADLGAELDPPV